MAIKAVQRQDTGELREPKRTREGYLYVEARIARPGIYIYGDGVGGEIRELIPRSVLAAPASLDSMKLKPITVNHPDVDVDSSNHKSLSVGDVGNEYRVDEDGRPIFPMYVKAKEAVDAIEAGVQEVSPGYMARVDFTPGVDPEFGPYDAVQVERGPYNHLAIVPAGRGGEGVRLRADAARQIRRVDDKPTKGKIMTLEEAIAAGIVVLKIDHDNTVAELSILKTDAAEAVAKVDTLTVEKAALQSTVDAIPSDADAAKARIDWFGERAEIVAAAGVAGIEDAEIVKTDNAALKKATVLKVKTDANQDGDPSYFDAAFDMLKGDLRAKADGVDDPYRPFNMDDTEAGGRKRKNDGDDKIPNPGESFFRHVDKEGGRLPAS